jgi:hypothetical protein
LSSRHKLFSVRQLADNSIAPRLVIINIHPVNTFSPQYVVVECVLLCNLRLALRQRLKAQDFAPLATRSVRPRSLILLA